MFNSEITSSIYNDNFRIVTKFQNIKHLSLSFPDFYIDNKLFQKLIHIESLSISDSYLPIIPNEIFSLNNLTSLSIINCGLREIATEIQQMMGLKDLNLCRNKISSLSNLCSLINLEKLYLSYNIIDNIPAEDKVLELLKNIDYVI